MDFLDMHERALDQTQTLVDGVRPDQLEAPTPCSDWDVRLLINHLVGGNLMFAGVAEGKPPVRAGAPRDLVGNDPAGAYRWSADQLKQAWRAPGRLEQQCELPFGTMPGQAALTMHLLETVAHGWDLARATGQIPGYDPDVVQSAAEFARQVMSEDRSAAPFAEPVEIGHDAEAVDQLAAFLGRRV